MTKRKLKGPASVRDKGKKTKVHDDKNEAMEPSSSEASSFIRENTESSMVKMEPSALLNNDDDGMMDKMSMLEDDEEAGLEPSLEQDNLDEEEDRALNAAVHDNEANVSKVASKKLQEKVELLEAEKKKQQASLKELQAKVELLETEKKDLATKYQKYKMLCKQMKDRENSLAKNSGSNNSSIKELEDENQELKMKLKSVVDNLNTEQESKCDVNSKLLLKDKMLQDQIIKNEELEQKFKNFLSKFYEKFSKQGANSLTENAVSTLQSSLAESKVGDHLSEKANPKNIAAKAKMTTDDNSSSTPSKGKILQKILPKPIEERSGSIDRDSKGSSSDKHVINGSSKANPSSNMKDVPSPVVNKGKPTGRKKIEMNPVKGKQSKEAREAPSRLNKSLPASASLTRTPTSRVASNVTSSKAVTKTPVQPQAPAASMVSSAEAKTLPSKLLGNTSITIGKSTEAEAGKQLATSSTGPPSTTLNSASARLSKLGNASLSISSSKALESKVSQLSKNSSITMTKPAAVSSSNKIMESSKSKGATPDVNTSKLLNNSGISFSKVSSNQKDQVPNEAKAPASLPAPTKALAGLKGLNISLNKPSTFSATKVPETKETPTPAEKSLALVPTSVPSPSSAKGKRRGPASVKRKAEKQSSTTLGNKKKEQKLLEEEVADADADKSSQDASSLSLTYEDNDNAREENYSVAISVGDDFSKNLNFDTSGAEDIPWDNTDNGVSNEDPSSDKQYESLLDSINNQLQKFSDTNLEDEKRLKQNDEKLLA